MSMLVMLIFTYVLQVYAVLSLYKETVHPCQFISLVYLALVTAVLQVVLVRK